MKIKTSRLKFCLDFLSINKIEPNKKGNEDKFLIKINLMNLQTNKKY